MNPLRIIVPIVVLGAAGWGAYYLATHSDPPQERRRESRPLQVDVIRVTKESYPLTVRTRGSVRPRTESTLISEVTGKVVKISPSFRDGGFFEAGEVLLEIDKLDYETAVVVAEGELARASSGLEEEKARSAQALENWKRLGRKGEPSALTLREPQLAEAVAAEAAARAGLVKAERDLLRTDIKAPYAGRVLRKEVDEGHVVNNGANLARVYAVDFAEIRLPLTDKQIGFVDLPESYRGDSADEPKPHPEVVLRGKVGGEDVVWNGKIVRVEGAIDQASRQLFVVAQVEDPYGRKLGDVPPLRVNLFVEAEIEGRDLRDVIVLPRGVVRADNEVIVVDSENLLRRRKVVPIWSDEASVVVAAGTEVVPGENPGDPPRKMGIEAGELVCATPIPFAADGVTVIPHVRGEVTPITEAGKGGQGGRRPGRPGGGAGKTAGGRKPGKRPEVSGEAGGAAPPAPEKNPSQADAS